MHDRFQKWREAGLFEAMWKAGLMEYDTKKKRQKRYKKKFADIRKRHTSFVAVDGANRHDKKLVKGTPDAIIAEENNEKKNTRL